MMCVSALDVKVFPVDLGTFRIICCNYEMQIFPRYLLPLNNKVLVPSSLEHQRNLLHGYPPCAQLENNDGASRFSGGMHSRLWACTRFMLYIVCAVIPILYLHIRIYLFLSFCAHPFFISNYIIFYYDAEYIRFSLIIFTIINMKFT